jgi:hypothetical protein
MMLAAQLTVGDRLHEFSLEESLDASEGTIQFCLQLDRTYASGLGVEPAVHPLITFPGLGEFLFRDLQSGPDLGWRWDAAHPPHPVFQGFPKWFGPETYCIQFVWNASARRAELFINGVPTREPGARFAEPWKPEGTAFRATAPASHLGVAGLRTWPRELSDEELAAAVPEWLRGEHAERLRDFPPPQDPLDGDALKGELLLRNPFETASDLEGWELEGPATMALHDGRLKITSDRPDAAPPEHGHSVLWTDRPFPGNFVAEWEVELLSSPGLLIVFFAAEGLNGKDIFDPSLRRRSGAFGQYISGDTRSYHISYYSNPAHEPGRTTSNLRKNPGILMLDQGPVGIFAGSQERHKIQLIHLDGEIQLSVDGRIAVRYSDTETERHGPPYTGGRIGLRQMQWTRVLYNDFRVWEARR